jgi:methylenetetrahydrofolate reductase (NADPH)
LLISDCFRKNVSTLSFEVFPPKKEEDFSEIYTIINDLAIIHPDFISVTYGANDRQRSEKTAEIASNIEKGFQIPALAHLTCISSTKNEMETTLLKLKSRGIQNVLALLGDPVENVPFIQEYTYASDLIRHIKHKHPDFVVGAAAYPEGHIQCEQFSDSIRYLRFKEEAGTDFFITQLFFDNEVFYRFLDVVRASGVTKPILAGIMPILSQSQIQRMIFMCGVSLPSRIIKLLYKYEKDPTSLRKAGIEYAALQAQELLRNRVDGIHIYTMNQPKIARKIYEYANANNFKNRSYRA